MVLGMDECTTPNTGQMVLAALGSWTGDLEDERAQRE